jgi:hypothetical protein
MVADRALGEWEAGITGKVRDDAPVVAVTPPAAPVVRLALALAGSILQHG